MRIALLLIVLITFSGELTVFAQSKAAFTFDETVIKFPKAEGGDVLNFSYPFTNSGTAPLVIDNIKVSCSCTKPTWPKKPIMPGQRDSITVEFNTKTVWGWQEKEMRIYSNVGENYTSIYFKGNVKKGEFIKSEQEK